MNRIIQILGCALIAVGAAAQSDTLTIGKYRAFEPVVANAPFMSDSVNISGQAFDMTSTLATFPQTRLDNSLLRDVSATKEGYMVTDSTLHDGKKSIQTYLVSLLSTNFEKGKLIIESDAPFRLFLDGKQIGQTDEKATRTLPLQLQPSVSHTLGLRLLSNAGGQAKWRIRFVPESKHTKVTFPADDHSYLSIQYMLTGESVGGTTVSPSGRYSTLTISEKVDNKPVYSVLLYDGDKPIAHLDGTYISAQWMPCSDKLWVTMDSDTGKRLIALDPSTMLTEVLHPSIPSDGYCFFTPTEDKLIYVTTDKGPENKKFVERVMDRYDTTGSYRNRNFLAIFDLRTGIYQPLTYGYRDTSLQGVSKDSKEIVFSNNHNTTEIPFSAGDYMTMDLQTLKVDTLFSNTSDISSVNYTSDPRYLLITGTANAFNGIGRNLPKDGIANTYDYQLFLYDRQTKTAKALTRDFDPSVKSVEPLFDKFEAYFTAENKDYVSLYRVDLRSGRITQVPTKEEVVRRFAVDNRGTLITYSGQSMLNSDRFYQIRNGRERLIYDLASKKMADLQLGTATEWSFTMPNGDVVPGRFYLPPNFDTNKKYPMIVYYYGGTSPTARTFEGSYSLPMFAAQDYVVLTLNPSGTTGWGQEYAARHINAWGQRTADEIIASVKGFCAQHPYVNADKIGCIGASYGGFMTMYLQTVTDTFAAAVSHAGISNIASYWGEGTWGIGYSTVASYGSYPWNNPELYAKQSPIFNADKINTPILLLHGTSDVNVPIGESVQMYNALKILGKEVEFIKIYGEDHGIYDPAKRLRWMQSAMAWFQRWLHDDPTWWNTLYPPVNL